MVKEQWYNKNNMDTIELDYLQIAEMLCQTKYAGVGEGFSTPYNAAKETFNRAFFRMLDERAMRASVLANRMDISRQIISRLRCADNYIVNKRTACALAFGLQLTLDETNDLLHKAGYHLSPVIPFDKVIIEFITNENYDIFNLNETLFEQTGSTLLELKNR